MDTKPVVKISVVFFFLSFSSLLFSQPLVRFAVIGDYGKWTTGGEALVSNMVHLWNPDFIITTGDNNYETGSDTTIDSNIGKYYHDYIYPYHGIFGQGAPFNKFFPSLGNHDLVTPNAQPYIDYFTLPGNERYYSYVRGNCEFFALNSDPSEPNGTDSNSIQGQWLKQGLQNSQARFKIVYFHHPPYSSGMHGSSNYMRWPFKRWGATVVLNGHEHDYERLVSNGFTYFICGLSGKDWREFDTVIAESRFRFTGNFGAMIVSVFNNSINFKFYSVPDSLKDDTTITVSSIGIEPVGNQIPMRYNLYPNYPNPFNPATYIKFDNPAYGLVELRVFDVSGRLTAELFNGELAAGSYGLHFEGSSLPSGIYFCRFESGGYSKTRKMILIK